MTGTITYILSRAGYRAMNGPLADERRRLAGAEPPAAYVSYDPRLLAGAGWYGYRIALKGGDRQMVERARYMLSERYFIRDGYEYYADGVYVFGVLMRERVPHYGIGGGAPTPEPDALNFYMPNGGTISLNKTGSPTVVELEYSLDGGQTWTVWPEDGSGNRSMTLTAGQRMYVRNTSETSTGFSTSSDNYYTFEFTTNTYANGNTNSLLCKTSDNAVLTAYCYRSLFAGCTSLINPPCLPSTALSDFCYRSTFYGCSSMIVSPELPATALAPNCYDRLLMDCTSIRTAPELPATNLASECYFGMFYNTSISVMPELPATTLANGCYQSMFSHCDLLESILDLPANILVENCYNAMFYLCPSLNYIKTQMITITATYCLNNWLGGVSQTGDFYCPASLTIPTGVSGIPSGWTRHNI